MFFLLVMEKGAAQTVKLCENCELGKQGSFVCSCQQSLVSLGTITTQVCEKCYVQKH